MIQYLTRDSWEDGTVDTWKEKPISDELGDIPFYHKENVINYLGSICVKVFEATIGLKVEPGKIYKLKTHLSSQGNAVGMKIKEVEPEKLINQWPKKA